MKSEDFKLFRHLSVACAQNQPREDLNEQGKSTSEFNSTLHENLSFADAQLLSIFFQISGYQLTSIR